MLVAVAVLGFAPTRTARASTLGLQIASIAQGEIGYSDSPSGTFCNKYSAYWSVGKADCGNSNRDMPWCADFAAWAWAQAGITGLYGRGINSNASSFQSWGQSSNNWHPLGSGYVPQPGDVAEYGGAHVAIFVGGTADSPTVVNGDWWYPDTTNGQVYQQAAERTDGAGHSLSGYVSPPNGVSPSSSTRMAFSNDSGAFFRPSDNSPWIQMAGPGATSVAVDGQRMAMIVPWQGAIFRVNDNSPWITITAPSTHPTSVSIHG